ncbi:unnamed protein product [Polarella glacialis]|uniref:Uncharacterized protein n=1 Tax=Polarella glacialis TaxID=89957 RepID=A0A813F5D8_POLGL|nr:unnamed protein product [Polarella glacialis]
MRGRVRNALQQVATTYNLGLVPKAAAAGVNLDDVLQNVTANMAKLFRNSADQAEEMEGLAVALGVPLLDVMRFNVFYELSGACTSMLANDYKHKDIVHGRNLDYGSAGLSDIVVNARFKKGAEVVFECTTFLGYVGCLTGMAPGRFSISLNQRDEKDEVGNIIGYKEWNNFMLAWQQGAQGYGFWIRQSRSQRLSWRDMVAAASSTLFTRAAYLAIGGTKLDEAVILERRTHAVQLARWMKASLRSEFPELAKVSYANDFDGKPFVFVCNSDMKHADEARDETAWKLLNALAPRGYGVKSVKGVMDFEGNSTLHQGLTVETTTFTSEMVAARGIYNTQAKCAVPQYSNIGSGLAPAR